MSKSQRTVLEDRISEVRKSILLMQGELAGLEFALTLKDEEKEEERKEKAQSSPNPKASKPFLIKPSVRSMTRKVVYANPSGISFIDAWKQVCQMAGRQVVKKTVSSSLNVFKEKREVNFDGKLYTPPTTKHAAQAA